MYTPSPFALLLTVLLSIALYLFLATWLLKVAARWVTDCVLSWGEGLKIVLIVMVAGLIIQLLLGMTAVGVAGYDVNMLQADPFYNLLAFLVLMVVDSYVYGSWIRCEQHPDSVGFAKGLLVFWAQVLIVILVGLGLMLLIGLPMWLMH